MDVSIQEILTQAFGFAVLFWIMKKYAWKPILDLLESRRTKISSSFEEIDKTKKELETLQNNYTARLAHIEEESRVKIQAAIQDGKQMAREIQEQARTQAKDILDKAKQDIELEADKARVTLRKEIVDLVFAATEKVVHEKLSGQKDEETIIKFVKELEASQEPLMDS
ncbi:MAG: ATP synthase F0 subunit B [Candidatus Omnitrophica bacterium CG11_big_fil_rev_8_21_14_0_20_45_26]|uniref:ATP synthase subunit b n=1 Tax=Candidatus Abzuiibacterium crystallinum TaxID=1974748 RepID=A0A2H0LM52_9BACT|nr:MAG: ATP synthase F0 subunit B [Candidatus Omnitrophica bacterium CG11_big_fil_rev_8_21_14_0_20_45_26]PIW63692.1 MAG: ATP synthase F0 subunit B [Candidatus Omnitrophica bacterium CG12_big_fil_rev_8_21_14_0_65_45_16]